MFRLGTARVDLSAAARAGENELEISVVNLWPDRLIGDAALPLEKRLTETNIRKFVATTPLLPSEPSTSGCKYAKYCLL